MNDVIREATAPDAQAIGLMHYAAWQEAYVALLPAGFFTPEAEQRWIARLVR